MRRILAIAAVLAAPGAAHAERHPSPLSVTSTIDFSIGSGSVGSAHGFTAPGGHFDLGVGLGRWRAQAELDLALWSRQPEDPDNPDDGSFRRGGVGLRYVWLPVYFGGPNGYGYLNNFVQIGLGHESVHTDTVDASRGDFEVAFGMAQEAHFGHAVVGGNFALRVLVADGAGRGVRRTGEPPSSDPDVAVFFDLGFVLGSSR